MVGLYSPPARQLKAEKLSLQRTSSRAAGIPLLCHLRCWRPRLQPENSKTPISETTSGKSQAPAIPSEKILQSCQCRKTVRTTDLGGTGQNFECLKTTRVVRPGFISMELIAAPIFG